ncbi:MAG: dTMP kinase [Candidatus Brocadiales bacterium]
MCGKLIVIAGIDGSGKTVQTELLSARLIDKGHEVRTTSFPQYGKTFFADMVTQYLHGDFGSLSEVSPYLASLLYAGDRWQAKEQIKTWLKEGKIVISNRYVVDNEAHQGGKIKNRGERERFLAWLNKLEYEIFGLPKADINIFLHVPIETACQLLKKKPSRDYLAGGKRDIHEDNIEHLKQAQEVYLEIATKPNNWAVIESVRNGALLPPENISDMVLAAVLPFLE